MRREHDLKRDVLLMGSVLAILALSAFAAVASCGNCETEPQSKEACGPKEHCSSEAKPSEECATECTEGSAKKAELAVINTTGLKALLDARVPVVVLDARSEAYDDGKRIPGAASVGTKPDQEKLSSVIKEKEALIVTYCSNVKCPASKVLYDHLKGLGYKNVLQYPQGIDEWAEAGNRTEKAM